MKPTCQPHVEAGEPESCSFIRHGEVCGHPRDHHWHEIFSPEVSMDNHEFQPATQAEKEPEMSRDFEGKPMTLKSLAQRTCACDRADCLYCGPRIAERVVAGEDSLSGAGASPFSDKRCTRCGALRLTSGVCSLVQGGDSKGGCPDPTYDYYAEKYPDKFPAASSPVQGAAPGPQEYRELCAELYQAAGVLFAEGLVPVLMLDKLSAGQRGLPLPKASLLPFTDWFDQRAKAATPETGRGEREPDELIMSCLAIWGEITANDISLPPHVVKFVQMVWQFIDPMKAVAPETVQPESQEKTCGKPAASLIPRWGMSWACALQLGHKGECQPGGNCVKHGHYISPANTNPQCPKWPDCITPASTGVSEPRKEPHQCATFPDYKPCADCSDPTAERLREIQERLEKVVHDFPLVADKKEPEYAAECPLCHATDPDDLLMETLDSNRASGIQVFGIGTALTELEAFVNNSINDIPWLLKLVAELRREKGYVQQSLDTLLEDRGVWVKDHARLESELASVKGIFCEAHSAEECKSCPCCAAIAERSRAETAEAALDSKGKALALEILERADVESKLRAAEAALLEARKAIEVLIQCPTCEGSGVMTIECMACQVGPGTCSCTEEECAQCDGKRWTGPSDDAEKLVVEVLGGARIKELEGRKL